MKDKNFQYKINLSKLTIYEKIAEYDTERWIPTEKLQKILNEYLIGINLDLPLRSRSKFIKSKICEALGYPVPKSFRKTKPRFIGQNFDTYIQKANNLQIWNDTIESNRRYVIIKVSKDDIIEKVKIITGIELAKLDKTGTLTQKYQAKLKIFKNKGPLLYNIDTDNIQKILKENVSHISSGIKPNDDPIPNQLLSTKEIAQKLKMLINTKIDYLDQDQERNRGAQIHEVVCQKIGYNSFQDDGKFPDIRNQLIEIKLQTSSTIDLGLVEPTSTEILMRMNDISIRHCDIRYIIIIGQTDKNYVTIQRIYITPGEKFYQAFTRFEGKVVNRKIQIPLPRDFF